MHLGPKNSRRFGGGKELHRGASDRLAFPLLRLFGRFAEAVALAVHLEDVAAVREAIQQRRGRTLALEDLAPLAKGQVLVSGVTVG